jgi:hypothetical protein
MAKYIIEEDKRKLLEKLRRQKEEANKSRFQKILEDQDATDPEPKPGS